MIHNKHITANTGAITQVKEQTGYLAGFTDCRLAPMDKIVADDSLTTEPINMNAKPARKKTVSTYRRARAMQIAVANPEVIQEVLRKAFKVCRERQKISQWVVDARFGSTHGRCCAYETGQRGITFAALHTFALACGIRPSEILREAEKIERTLGKPVLTLVAKPPLRDIYNEATPDAATSR